MQRERCLLGCSCSKAISWQVSKALSVISTPLPFLPKTTSLLLHPASQDTSGQCKEYARTYHQHQVLRSSLCKSSVSHFQCDAGCSMQQQRWHLEICKHRPCRLSSTFRRPPSSLPLGCIFWHDAQQVGNDLTGLPDRPCLGSRSTRRRLYSCILQCSAGTTKGMRVALKGMRVS